MAKAARTPGARELHRVRIGAKRLRYAAELAEPVIKRPARRTGQCAAALQTVLGDHHDTVAALQWLEGHARGGRPDQAFAAGWLAADQQARQDGLASEWRAVWRRLDRPKSWRWTKG